MPSAVNAPNVAIGELLWDLLPAGPRLGGTTANYAILIARLGASSALVSCVGKDDFGARALSSLDHIAHDRDLRGSIDVSNVQTSSTYPTGTVSVELDSQGRPNYVIHSPVAWDVIELTSDALELARSASVVCFGTLAQRGATSRATIRAFIEATSSDAIRVCDLNLRMPFCSADSLRWALAHATVLKVSDEELPEVGRLLGDARIGAHLDHDLTLAATTAAQALLEIAPQCRMVAVTLGQHGSVLVDTNGSARHPGFPTQVVDTVGAGDAFTAGLVHSICRGANLQRVNHVANLCGSFVASQPGATPALPASLLDQIDAILT
jgi:fructokinase